MRGIFGGYVKLLRIVNAEHQQAMAQQAKLGIESPESASGNEKAAVVDNTPRTPLVTLCGDY